MKLLAFAFLALLPANLAFSATGYVCGNSDGVQKYMYKSTNLAALRAQVLAECRRQSSRPQYCYEPFCQSYELESAPAKRKASTRRAPAPRKAARPAPRRTPKDYCDATCGAIRAVKHAEEQARKDKIDQIIRDYDSGRLHR